jgi:hypothetical protein
MLLSTVHLKRMESGGIDPHILNLGITCRSVVSLKPLPLNPQELSPSYPFCRRLDGPQGRSVLYGEEKVSCPYQELNPGRPTCSLGTIPD